MTRRGKKTQQAQLRQTVRLSADGFDLFFPDQPISAANIGEIIHIHHDRITFSAMKGKGVAENSGMLANPDAVLLTLSKQLQGKKKVLISVNSDACLTIQQKTTSLASQACEEVATFCARTNSPFTPNKTLYFWRKNEDYKTSHTITVYIMQSDAMRLIYIALRNANVEAIGITTSQDYLNNQPICLPGWLAKKPEKGRKKYATSVSHYVSRLPRVYKLLLASCCIFVGSGLASMFFSEQKLLLLDNASAEARSELQRFASAGRLSQRLFTLRRDADFRINFVNNIAKNLEDDAWATRIRINDQAVEISGISKSTANTLRNLAQTEGTTNVRLLSSVTRDPNTQLERFIIGLDFK